ncbi:MAG: HmuY family protein [Chitinophagales bacterium]|nr:HmuY family protein [Chitinophagales bacterium]
MNHIKKYNISYALWFTLLLIISSCFKEDESVTLPPPGDAQIFRISQGEDYHRQQYFDLNTTDTLGSEYSSWDLCFQSNPTGWHIWLNGGNFALIANMNTQDFDAVHDTTGASWHWDEASWNPDSTAIGDWRDVRLVYVLDRGFSKPAAERYKKIIFQSEDESKYEIQFSNLDGSEQNIVYVPKNSLNSYAYFTFNDGGSILNIEPAKQQWDMLFTRYRYIFYDEEPPLPYLVTGVLINPEISVAVDSSMTFSEIDYQIAITLTYSNTRDVIGWKWKHFDLSTSAYTVHQNVNYIIRDMEGVYWKLHFIDFYNEEGDKGYPQFEFQRL